MFMDTEKLYELLEIPEYAAEKLRQCRSMFRLEDVEPYLAGMMIPNTAAKAYRDLKTVLRDDVGGFKMLLCQLECAGRCHALYHAKGIPERIFVDTMKCFRRFLRECENRTGEIHFDRGWWTYRQISMCLFRIGELEYELCQTETEKTVSVHIPSDAVFRAENVDESLRQAERFIERYYPDYRQAKRVCSSWLLSPALGKLLPTQSNILDFQRRFEIIEVYAEDREFMEWIFDAPKDAELSGLPESTSLQRAAKRLLQEGGSIGAAYGIMK